MYLGRLALRIETSIKQSVHLPVVQPHDLAPRLPVHPLRRRPGVDPERLQRPLVVEAPDDLGRLPEPLDLLDRELGRRPVKRPPVQVAPPRDRQHRDVRPGPDRLHDALVAPQVPVPQQRRALSGPGPGPVFLVAAAQQEVVQELAAVVERVPVRLALVHVVEERAHLRRRLLRRPRGQLHQPADAVGHPAGDVDRAGVRVAPVAGVDGARVDGVGEGVVAAGRQEAVEGRPGVDGGDGEGRVRGGREPGAGRGRGRGRLGLVPGGGGGGVALRSGEERDALAARDGEELGLGHAGVAHHADRLAVADDGGACFLGQSVGAGKAVRVSRQEARALKITPGRDSKGIVHVLQLTGRSEHG